MCMFGGEAKIRKLPTPDRTFKKDAADNATSSSFSDNAENSDEKLDIQETDVKDQASDMDYTISGTISPLPGIHESPGKRGTESKISFVFGRPPSPTSRCMSPPRENHVPAVARKGPYFISVSSVITRYIFICKNRTKNPTHFMYLFHRKIVRVKFMML